MVSSVSICSGNLAFECTIAGQESDDYVINPFRLLRLPGRGRLSSPNVRFNKTQHRRPFKGTCNACSRPNCHASDCFFLKKLKSCLSHIECNSISPSQLCTFQRSHSNYSSRSNAARSLVDENFAPYDNIDPDAFINALQDDKEHFVSDENLSEDL